MSTFVLNDIEKEALFERWHKPRASTESYRFPTHPKYGKGPNLATALLHPDTDDVKRSLRMNGVMPGYYAMELLRIHARNEEYNLANPEKAPYTKTKKMDTHRVSSTKNGGLVKSSLSSSPSGPKGVL